MPRIQPLCLSCSSLPAGDTFNIPCMTRAAQPLSHIPQLASHHPAACERTTQGSHPCHQFASRTCYWERRRILLKLWWYQKARRSWSLNSSTAMYKEVFSICSSAPLCFIEGLHILGATKWLGGNPAMSQIKSLLL